MTIETENDKRIDLPDWVDSTLQGLAYWVGYKRQYYSNYLLTEGAIVGETCQLIAAKLEQGFSLNCEIMFKEMIPSHDGGEQCDLVIQEEKTGFYEAAIEVKRYKAGKTLIQKDLDRLHQIKTGGNVKRCFLIVVSQKEFPGRYVTSNGNAKKNTNFSESDLYKAFCRRACKTSTNFKITSTEDYALMFEVV